jgi:hypothetical protein
VSTETRERLDFLDPDAPPRRANRAAGAGPPRERVAPAIRTARTWARAHPELALLVGLLAVGVLLRVYFTIQWRPSITGYSDSGIYFQDATTGPFADPLRVVGYGMFLSALHWITPHLLLVTVVQHLLGLLTAVLLFATVRRCGGPPMLGLAPAAVVTLGGTQLFLEHAALAETLFTFLIALLLYAAVRAWRGWFGWAALAGACAGISVTVRGAGAIVVPVVVVWLLFCRGRPTRDTALAAVLALVLSLGVIAGYIGWRHADTGLGGLTTNGNWNLYGRVAPFADCTKFKPPAGTEGLCDPTPPNARLGRFPEQGPGPGPGGNRWTSEYYIYFPTSPAQKLFGPPYLVSSDPKANAKLQKWSIAVIKGQPLDYLDAVWNDTVRIVLPNHHSFGDLSADENIAFMLGGPDLKSGANDFVKYWQDRYYPNEEHHQGSMTWLRDYEALTRVEGGWMLLLLALAAVAPLAVPRRARAGAYLLVLMAFALLWFPIVTKGYDFRFVIPTLGPLFGAAALGAWGLVLRARGPGAPHGIVATVGPSDPRPPADRLDGVMARPSAPAPASSEPEGHRLCGVCGAATSALPCESCGASVDFDVEESPARAQRVLEAARELVSNLVDGPGSGATPGMSGDHWKMSIGPDVAIGPVVEHRDGTRSPACVEVRTDEQVPDELGLVEAQARFASLAASYPPAGPARYSRIAVRPGDDVGVLAGLVAAAWLIQTAESRSASNAVGDGAPLAAPIPLVGDLARLRAAVPFSFNADIESARERWVSVPHLALAPQGELFGMTSRKLMFRASAVFQEHPRWGNGLHVTGAHLGDLGIGDRQVLERLVRHLAERDRDRADVSSATDLLGSWSLDLDGKLSFVTFVPESLCEPGLLVRLVDQLIGRFDWLDRVRTSSSR